MADYLKFWMAKELVAMWPLVLIFGGFALLYLGAVIYDKTIGKWKRRKQAKRY